MTVVASSEKIRTTRGLVRADEVTDNDSVLDADGNSSRVSSISSKGTVPVVSSLAGTIIPEGSSIRTKIDPSNSVAFNPDADGGNIGDIDPTTVMTACEAMSSSMSSPAMGSSVRGAVEAIKQLELPMDSIPIAMGISGVGEEAAIEGVLGTYFAMDRTTSSIMSNPVGAMSASLPRDILGYTAVMSAMGKNSVIDQNTEAILTEAGGIIIGPRDQPRSVMSRLGTFAGSTSRAVGFLMASGADITKEHVSFVTGLVPVALNLLLGSHTEADWDVQWTNRPPLAVLSGSNPAYGAWTEWLPDVSEFLTGVTMAGVLLSFTPHPNCIDLIERIPGLDLDQSGEVELNPDYVMNMKVAAGCPGLVIDGELDTSGLSFTGGLNTPDSWPAVYGIPGDVNDACSTAEELFKTNGQLAWGLIPEVLWDGTIDDINIVALDGSSALLEANPAFFDADPDCDFFDLSERVSENMGEDYFDESAIDKVVSEAFLAGYHAYVGDVPVGDEYSVEISGGNYTTVFSAAGNEEAVEIKTEKNSGVSIGFEGLVVI